MFVNFQLRNVAMIILSLLFVIEVGAKIGVNIVIIVSGICYFGILEIRKVYRAENLIKERADRKNLTLLQNLNFLIQDTNIINTKNQPAAKIN